METEFLHDFENFSNFGSQGSGLNLAGTFFEKVIDHELAFRDDIPQPDYWLSPLDDFGSSSLSPSALSLRGDGCDFSLRDLNHAFDTSDLQRDDVNNLDSWTTPSDDLAQFSDFSFIKQESEANFRDRDENLLGVTNVSNENSFKSEYYSFEDESHIDVESVDGVSDVPEHKNDHPSFLPLVSSCVQSAGSPKPIKPCSLLEKHLRSPIQTIINAAQRPSSISSCTRLNNCKIIREASAESSGKAKSNGRKQKIPIAQAIPNKKAESSSNRMIDAGRTLNRNKLIKLVTTGSSGETILLDHDYCTNSSKNTFSASALELNDTKRLPSRQSEFESVHVSANKVASVKVTHNGFKSKEASKDFSKTKPVKSKVEAVGSKFADAKSFTSNKISKVKSCDNETAFRKDALPKSIVQNSVTKDRGKSSISLEDTPSDSKITQTHVPEIQKVTLKEPVMVSLLNKSSVLQDPLKVVLPNNACNGKKKNSNTKTVLPEGTYNDKTSTENETMLPDDDKNKHDARSALSMDVQGTGKFKSSSNESHANENHQKSSYSDVKVKKGDKKRKNKFNEGTTKHSSSKTVIAETKEQSKSKSRSRKDEKSHLSKVDVQSENLSKSNSRANAKKVKQEDKKVAESKSTGNQSTSHLKDLTKGAKTVINNYKNNSKSDLNLPIRNSNVISSDNIKEAHLGSYQSEIGLPNCKRKEAAQSSSACPVKSQENESYKKSRNVFKKEQHEEKAATMLPSPQEVNALHIDQAVSSSEDSDLGIQCIKAAQNYLEDSSNEKAVTSESLDKSDRKMCDDNPKTEPVEKRVCSKSEDKSFSQDQNRNGVEKYVSESEKCSADKNQSNKTNVTNLKASENEEKLDSSVNLPIKCEPVTSAETLPEVDSTTSNTQNEDSMENSPALENRSSEAVANGKENPVSLQNSSSIVTKKEVENLEKEVSTSGKKRKLNLSEYRDRQRKRLDPGIMFVAKWKIPIIELDSSVTDPANRRSFRDLINQMNEAKAKTVEPVSSTTDIAVIEVKLAKVGDSEEKARKKNEDKQDLRKNKEVTQNSKKNDEVSRSLKKNKDLRNSKTNHEEGAKKVAAKQMSTSVKEKNSKRRSRSINGKDPSSERSKRCRSSRSSSASNKSPKRYRRRTPISYRPSSRSSFSSNSSSSRSPSRSRSHSRSRSYRNRSYRYRNDYRRRSRESDRRSRDYYRHRDRSNRYRSRSREDRRRSRDGRTRSRDRRTRSREDRRRSRENSYHSKNYRLDRSSSSSRKTSSLSPVLSEVYRPLQSRNYNISPVDIAIAEGRMIYIGKIENVSQSDLLDRFKEFGPIVDVNLHFKEYGKNYGFVTFKYACDAKRAIKYGNDNKSLPQYDICYGGRRQVCNDSYADLSELYGLANLGYSPYHSVVDASASSKKVEEEDSFDALLQDFRRAVSERTQKEI